MFELPILFFLFLAVLGLCCGMQDLSLRVQRLFVAARGLLSSCGVLAPGCMGSVIVLKLQDAWAL